MLMMNVRPYASFGMRFLVLIVLHCVLRSDVAAQEPVAALNRLLIKTHMRQEVTSVTFSDSPVAAFAPTTVQCRRRTCTVRVEVTSQFLNVPSGNAARIHVQADGKPFAATGFDVDGGINRPVAHLTTVSYLKTGLSSGAHTITVEFDLRSGGSTAEAGIRTLTIQVFAP
jgi:hypothetical protein